MEDIIVIHDDLQKDFGKISRKLAGSVRYTLSLTCSGHNGLKSIKNRLRSDVYYVYHFI